MGRDKSLGSLLLVLFVFCIAGSQAGQYCYKYHRYYYTTSATYCTYGCCGSSGNQYCCDSDVGLIVGGVVAGILCVSILVAVVCCCIKKQSRTGRVIHPTVPARPGANVTVIYTGASSQYPGAYPMGTALPMQAAQPPAYKPYAPPPAYNYSDPVYPPTAPPANLGASIYPPRVPSAPSSPVPPTGLNSSGSVAPPNTSLRQ